MQNMIFCLFLSGLKLLTSGHLSRFIEICIRYHKLYTVYILPLSVKKKNRTKEKKTHRYISEKRNYNEFIIFLKKAQAPGCKKKVKYHIESLDPGRATTYKVLERKTGIQKR